MDLGHRIGKTPVLRQGFSPHIIHGKQALLPLPAKIQSLLRAVAKMLFALYCQLPSPCHTLTQSQLCQQILNLGGRIIWYWQVVRTQRASKAIDGPGAAVAAHVVFQLKQRKVFDAPKAQRTRCRQSRDAAASNEHLHAVGLARQSRQLSIA